MEWTDASTLDPLTGLEPSCDALGGAGCMPVTVTDTVPADIGYLGSDTAPDEPAPLLLWDLGCLDSGDSVTIKWWGTVNAAVPAPTVVENRAYFVNEKNQRDNLALLDVGVLGTTTPTPTASPTRTASPTPTVSATLTASPTMSLTFTRSHTSTISPTSTTTPTRTESYTPTPSGTATPTLSFTSTPFFSYEVEIVNEAGEVVKVFYETRSGGLPQPGELPYQGGEVLFDVNGGVFRDIKIGDWTISWDGTLDEEAGEMIANGSYQVVVRRIEEDGNWSEELGTLVVMKAAGEFKVSVYDEMGRKVKGIPSEYTGTALGEVKAEPGLIKPGSGEQESCRVVAAGGAIKMIADGEPLSWDGRDGEGMIVRNGVYDVLVERQDIDGKRELKEVRVTVIRGAGGAIENVVVCPNPKVITHGDTMVRIEYDVVLADAVVKAKMYNVAGELVCRAENYDPKRSYIELEGDKLSAGVYIVLIEAWAGASPDVFRRIKKVVVLK